MIRTTLLWMFIAVLAAYAWKDWFKSLCGLVLLMAVVEHPDFPKSIAGIQGLNPWNVLLLIVVMAWFAARKREQLKWDMPKKVNRLLIAYFIVIVIAFIRLVLNLDELAAANAVYGVEDTTFMGQFSEGIINCFKWVIPGLLIYDGCRNEKRAVLACYCIAGIYVLLAIQVIRWMPLSSLGGGSDLGERSLKIIENEVGYHRVNMAMLLAGGFWAVFCIRGLTTSKLIKVLTILTSAIVFFGLGMTGGRMGLIAWVLIAGCFGLFKWKKLLVLGPVMLLTLLLSVPAIEQRVTEGLSADTVDSNARLDGYQTTIEGADVYTVTAGRTFAWSFVIPKIGSAPFFGYGREAMKTTGLATYLLTEFGETFPHPHNAYLQWLLDNGILGFIPIFLFYWFMVRTSLSLFVSKNNVYFEAIGGLTASLILALLISSIGSQTFYPREGAVGMWCAIGLMMRIHVQGQYWGRVHPGQGVRRGTNEFWKVPDKEKQAKLIRYV